MYGTWIKTFNSCQFNKTTVRKVKMHKDIAESKVYVKQNLICIFHIIYIYLKE